MASPMQKVSTLVSAKIGDTLSNIKNWGGLFYNAGEYGIVPGVDATEKLQELVNLAKSEGRSTIVFPEAAEYIVTSITNDGNIVYFGDGASFTGGYGRIINSFADYLNLTEQLAEIPPIVSIKKFGAVGDTVLNSTFGYVSGHNDSQAFIDAVAYCTANNCVLFIPKTNGFYYINQTILINAKVTIMSDPQAEIYLDLLMDEVGFLIQGDIGVYDIALPQLIGNRAAMTGTALKIDGAGFGKTKLPYTKHFNIGIHITSEHYHCLDPIIDANIVYYNTTSVKIESLGHALEGVNLKFNFISETSYGIHISSDDWLNYPVRYCDISGVAIDALKIGGGGHCIYGRIENSNIKVTSFFGGDNTIGFGGLVTVLGVDDNFYATNSTFDIAFTPVGNNFIFARMAGVNTKITNLLGRQNIATYDLANALVMSETHGETASNITATNVTLVKVTFPAANTGTILQRFMYHYFALNGWSKVVNIQPLDFDDDFKIYAYDNSHAVYRELVVSIKYTAPVTVSRDVYFIVEYY